MLNIHVGLSRNSRDDWESAARFVAEAERLGAESVWAAETWGFDGPTALAYVAQHTERIRLGTSIMQLGARTPSMTAMTAMSLASMTGGRFVLGLGVSTPQIMEAWHGVPFDSPVRRTREEIEILRLITARERLRYDGKFHKMPYSPELPAMRSAVEAQYIPVYIAAVGPANLRLTGELADGWIGNCFIPENAAVYFDEIRAGAERAGRAFEDIELQVPVTLEFGDDVDQLIKDHARGYAFTFGAMGTAHRNFYVDAFAKQGFEEVRQVERLWLEGDVEAARDLVPLELAEKSNLLGTEETIMARLRAYRDAGVDSLRVGLRGDDIDERLEELARLIDLVKRVDEEDTDEEGD